MTTHRGGRSHKAIAMTACAVLAWGAASCEKSGSAAAKAPASKASGPTTAAPNQKECASAGVGPATPAGGYALGQRTVTFVDHSRPTNADPNRHLLAKPDRTIPVTMIYPSASGAVNGPFTEGAAPASGAFPLVVLSHGVTANGGLMVTVLQAWAHAGYVIAAPTYPLSSGGGAGISDLPQQPRDLAFVVRSLQTLLDQPDDPLRGHVETACVALAGHSLGAVTTLEAAYESGFAVPGLRAAIEMSGLLFPLPPGTFANAPAVPLLLIHGDADTTVPISGSQNAFATLTGPRYFITFHGGSHNSIFGPPYSTVLHAAVIKFLDAEMKGKATELSTIGETVSGSGVATLQTHP